MKTSEKEIEAVAKLDPFQRYHYLIKRVADTEKIYTLTNSKQDFALAEVEGAIVFSVWSSKEFAQNACCGMWKEYEPKEISLKKFQEKFFDKMEKENWLINVFPIRNKSGFVVEIDEFVRDLTDELKKY